MLSIGVAGEGDPADWDAVCALALPAAAVLHPRDQIRVHRMCVRLRPFDIEARIGLAEQLVAAGDTASAVHVLNDVKDAAALDVHKSLGVIMDQSQAMWPGRDGLAEERGRDGLAEHDLAAGRGVETRSAGACRGDHDLYREDGAVVAYALAPCH